MNGTKSVNFNHAIYHLNSKMSAISEDAYCNIPTKSRHKERSPSNVKINKR